MTKTELESKHLAELHALAAEAGVPRYRMLRREELIEKLADSASGEKPKERQGSRQRRERKPREHSEGSRRREPRERKPRERSERRERAEQPRPEQEVEAAEPAPEKSAEAAAGERRPRRRRRRRFGRRRKELRLQDLVAPGRQTIVYADSRAACTTLLREFAANLAGESDGPDPVALLIDPGPEELADWRRDAPQAEIVAAAQARHAGDAIAQAARRAEGGENVIVLIDSLTRLVELGGTDDATDLLGASRAVAVVAALEHH